MGVEFLGTTLIACSPRYIEVGDRLLLPAADPSVISWTYEECYLSEPVTWITDLTDFRSGRPFKVGEMVVKFTDKGHPAEFSYDLYGIDFRVVYLERKQVDKANP